MLPNPAATAKLYPYSDFRDFADWPLFGEKGFTPFAVRSAHYALASSFPASSVPESSSIKVAATAFGMSKAILLPSGVSSSNHDRAAVIDHRSPDHFRNGQQSGFGSIAGAPRWRSPSPQAARGKVGNVNGE